MVHLRGAGYFSELVGQGTARRTPVTPGGNPGPTFGPGPIMRRIAPGPAAAFR